MGWFTKRTVETIVAPITKIVDELKEHAEQHDHKAQIHGAEIRRQEVLAQEAEHEAHRAKSAAHKFSGLVG